MNNPSKQSLKLFLILSAIITVISALALFFLSKNGVLPQKAIYVYPFMFFAINLLVHYLLLVGSQKAADEFINYFLIGTSAKLFLYFIFLIVYITVISKTNNKSFAAVFFVLYLLYTSVEVFAILKHIKNVEKQKNKAI